MSQSPNKQTDDTPDSLGETTEPSPALAKAIEEFAAATETRRIENICKAYQAIKTAGDGLPIAEILPMIDEVIGQSSGAVIVSAYSHGHCFMCTNGSVPCEACNDYESAERTECSHCNSTGLAPCDFCDGSGWIANDVIPHELHRAVWKNRLKRTHKVLEKYAALYTQPFLQDLAMRPFDNEQRQRAIMETIRLSAKLHALTNSCAVTDPVHRKHLESAEQKVRTCLNMLAWK